MWETIANFCSKCKIPDRRMKILKYPSTEDGYFFASYLT